MLMIAGGWLFELIRFCTAIKPPNVVEVSAHVAITIAALGAADAAHSASRMASPSFDPTKPGFAQFPGCTVLRVPEKDERPNVERNVFQSDVLKRFVFSMSAIVWPCPDTPELKRGFKL
jgi:hypothetical protein